MNKYTSLKLAKKLAENWCELESEYAYYGDYVSEIEYFLSHDWSIEQWRKLIPAYDILNDICVKHAKEFFGEDDIDVSNSALYRITHLPAWVYVSENILSLLQQWKKQEAEDYILKHTIFNPNNK